MEDITYATAEEQIEKLKKQNLIITNEQKAKELLDLFGYSNLIKSYREPYTIISDGKKVYRSGVTFEQIYSLYLLDKNLRNAVMASMIDLEEHIKEVAADIVAKSFGTHPDDYLQFRHYSNKRKRKYRFTLAGILEVMRNTLNTDKNPIYHYKTEHGIVPPWILFKSIYFSTIVNFIDQFKPANKNEMIHKLYNFETLDISDESARILLMDTLSICLEYRNIAAHGGRTYNHICQYPHRINNFFTHEDEREFSGFGLLLDLLQMYKYQAPYLRLAKALNTEVNRHCSSYPEDVTYLGQILNLDIKSEKVVWISSRNKKYHSDPHCSGMINAKRITLESALCEGYTSCKRCY